jgi:hypothetical protein
MLISAMFAIFLPFLSIIGFASFFSRYLTLPLAPLLFASTAFIGVLQFLLAMTNYLSQGSLVILIFGTFLFTYYLFTAKENWRTIGFYLLFTCFIILFDFRLQFSSIDDYSFWGVMSKYLFYFNRLPTNSDFISASFLTYTPGMACFHYLFYYATSQYSQFAGFIGQGAILLSALMVLFDPKNLRTSIFQIAIAYIILNVGFGTLLARMEVDGYVAAHIFAIAWLLLTLRPAASPRDPEILLKTRSQSLQADRPGSRGLAAGRRDINATGRKGIKTAEYKEMFLMIFFPILFLSLIKEIGLFFGVILTIAFFVVNNKSRKNVALSALLFVGLFGLKWIWLLHVHQYGFNSFSRAIHLPNAIAALNPFNTYFQPAQILVIKSLFLGRFGHVLEWPNIVTYAMLFYMWHKMSTDMQGERRQRAMQLRWIFVAAIICYAIMLYLLQAITFDVGHTFDHTLDFQRYFNMLLIPFFLFSLLVYTEEKIPQHQSSWQKHIPLTIMLIALTFAISGKIERTIRYNRPNEIYPLIDMVRKQLPDQEDWTLCLENPPQPAYQTTIPMAYFLLPKKVKLLDSPGACNYLLAWSTSTKIPMLSPSRK